MSRPSFPHDEKAVAAPEAKDNKAATSSEAGSNKSDHEVPVYPGPIKRLIIMTAGFMAIFLVILDQNIISTAIPRITDDFHSLDDVGWYGTAYLLTTCSFQLLMGKVYKYYPAKPIFMAFCLIFEVGSAICGAAPNSTAFIIGRAIAGLGSAGIFSGVLIIMFLVIPLQQRPIYQGCFGAIYAVGSVVGPLIGGSFTDKVTWRWCFYINLPIGAVAIVATFFILHFPGGQKLEAPGKGFMGKLKQLDPIGNLAFFPGVICLVLALQWGGTKYAWSDARIIVLLVLFGVLVIAFIAIQIWKGEQASLPPRLVMKRSIASSVTFGFFSSASLMVLTYYLPLWFQAIKGVSALKSGLMLLPLVIGTFISAMSAGIITSKIGYYTQFFYISAVMAPIGCGLMTTFTPETGAGKWIGYQILAGFGIGFATQQPMTVAQTVLDRPDIATGTAFVMFLRLMGSAIFLPVGQNLFLNQLVSKMSNISGVDARTVANAGATSLRSLAKGDNLSLLLKDYNDAIVDVFYMVTALAAVTIIPTVFIEWVSLKKRAEEAEGKKIVAEESGPDAV